MLIDYISGKKLIYDERQIVRPNLICEVRVKDPKPDEEITVRLLPLFIIQDDDGNFIGHFKDFNGKTWCCIYDVSEDAFIEHHAGRELPVYLEEEKISIIFLKSEDEEIPQPSEKFSAGMILHLDKKLVRFFIHPEHRDLLPAVWDKNLRAWTYEPKLSTAKKVRPMCS